MSLAIPGTHLFYIIPRKITSPSYIRWLDCIRDGTGQWEDKPVEDHTAMINDTHYLRLKMGESLVYQTL